MKNYKNFIPLAKKKQLRKDIMYQLIVEDICDVFSASEKEKGLFKLLINGGEIVSKVFAPNKPAPVKHGVVEGLSNEGNDD